MQTRERSHFARSVFPFIKKKKKKNTGCYSELRIGLLTSQVSTLSVLFTARLAAPQAFGEFIPASVAPSQARLESDARCPHPVGTAG